MTIGSKAEGQLIKVAFHLYCVWIMRVRVGQCQRRREEFGGGERKLDDWSAWMNADPAFLYGNTEQRIERMAISKKTKEAMIFFADGYVDFSFTTWFSLFV